MTLRRAPIRDYLMAEAYQRAIHAVREAIRLGPALDEALEEILAEPLDPAPG